MNSPQFSFLSQGDTELMLGKVFKLLEKQGVRMEHPAALKVLEAAGVKVDFDTQTVRFPKKFLEEQISKTPKRFSLYGRDSKFELHFPTENSTFYTRTNTGAHSWIEPTSGHRRRVRLADIALWAQITNELDNIDFCGYPTPNDVPTPTADVYALKSLLQYSAKHIWVQPYSEGSVDYLIQLGAAAAGGVENLKNRSPVSFIACSLSPLVLKPKDLDIILKCAPLGIPLHLCSLPSAGSTAPITEPGAAILSVAEILAMVSIAQVIQPGIPVIATPIIFSSDMRTGKSLQSSVRSLRSCALAVHLINRTIGIPTHTYGIGTDSPSLGSQSLSEGILRCALIALSGADILGGAGQIEVATTISPVQLVIDNEISGTVRQTTWEMEINEESLAWDDLMGIEHGGHFLKSKHTRRHTRDHLPSRIFTNKSRELWEDEGRERLIERARNLCQVLIKTTKPIPLSEETIREMDHIAQRANHI
jgi:trimethylamine:corrinoid methyltransferase-like protein